jgi:hypothetical protein
MIFIALEMIKSLFSNGFLINPDHPDENILFLLDLPDKQKKRSQSDSSYDHHRKDIPQFAAI